MAKPNKQRERMVALIIKAGGRCLWQTRVKRLCILECWLVHSETLVLQAFDRGGVDVFTSGACPHEWGAIEAWVAGLGRNTALEPLHPTRAG